jgi:hypothetical protein
MSYEKQISVPYKLSRLWYFSIALIKTHPKDFGMMLVSKQTLAKIEQNSTSICTPKMKMIM